MRPIVIKFEDGGTYDLAFNGQWWYITFAFTEYLVDDAKKDIKKALKKQGIKIRTKKVIGDTFTLMVKGQTPEDNAMLVMHYGY